MLWNWKKKSIPFIMECNACLIKDKLVSQNPMEIILLPQKSWIRPKQILTLKEIRTELQINRNEQWRRPFSDPYQLPRFCMSGRFQRLLEFFWPTRPHNSTFLHIMIFGSFQINFVLSVFGTTKLFWGLFKIAIAIKINNYPKPKICN